MYVLEMRGQLVGSEQTECRIYEEERLSAAGAASCWDEMIGGGKPLVPLVSGSQQVGCLGVIMRPKPLKYHRRHTHINERRLYL